MTLFKSKSGSIHQLGRCRTIPNKNRMEIYHWWFIYTR